MALDVNAAVFQKKRSSLKFANEKVGDNLSLHAGIRSRTFFDLDFQNEKGFIKDVSILHSPVPYSWPAMIRLKNAFAQLNVFCCAMYIVENFVLSLEQCSQWSLDKSMLTVDGFFSCSIGFEGPRCELNSAAESAQIVHRGKRRYQ